MWILICTILGLAIGGGIGYVIPHSGGGWFPGLFEILGGLFFGAISGLGAGICIEAWNFSRANKEKKSRIVAGCIMSMILLTYPFWSVRLQDSIYHLKRNFIKGTDQTVQEKFLAVGPGFGTAVGQMAQDQEGNIFVTYPSVQFGEGVEANGIKVGPVAKMGPDGLVDLQFAKNLKSACKGFHCRRLEMEGEFPDGDYLMLDYAWEYLRIKADGSKITSFGDFNDPQIKIALEGHSTWPYKDTNEDLIRSVMRKVRSHPDISFRGQPHAAVQSDDGSFYIGGDFVTRAYGMTWINIMRVLPSGDISTTFKVRTR